MATTINTTENTVLVSSTENDITITNNNTGTSVSIDSNQSTSVTVSAAGIKGDQGPQGTPGSVEDTIQADNIIQPFNHVTASGAISASGTITARKIRVVGSEITLENGHISASGNISSSGTITANAFIGDGSGLTGVTSYTDSDTQDFINSINIISGSAQLASDISGSFGATSASLATRITDNTTNISTNNSLTFTNLDKIISLTSVTGSYATTGSISGSFVATSASLASAIATNLSRNTSNTDTISANTTKITSLTAATSSYALDSNISGSLGPNATLIRSLTATSISESFTSLSGSIATRFDGLTSDYTELTNIPIGIISSSAQLTSSLNITGSLNISSSLTSSTAIFANNIQTGYPTSNRWQTNLEGSYFNNFDNTTHVSEILRFVAGLLSSSAANPTPNTRTYSSISENKSNTGTTSAPSGYVPQDQDIDDITYLINSGFAAEGGTLFPGKTIFTNTGYAIDYTSVAGGSSTVESSADSQLFGLGVLNSGNASEFQVKGTHAFRFNNNNSGTQTEISSSSVTLSNSSFGTSDGVTVAIINTVNPAVIPAAFQDGKFANVFSQNIMGWTTEADTSVSASGTYILDTTIGIKTGSQSSFVDKTASETIFWAPVSSINTNLGSQTLSTGSTSVTSLTLTSGSLSGAPYITGGTYKLISTASGLFEPLYAASSTLGDVTITSPTPSNVTVTNTSGIDTVSTSGGTIQTSNAVYSTSGVVRNTSTIPFRTDNFHIDATYTLSGTGNTFSESGFADTDFILAIKGRNRAGSQSTLKNNTINIHTSGTFGQLVASGSMGYFGGGTASTTLIERFTNETYRRVILSPTDLTTAWTSTDRIPAGDGEGLQVKPGYLVNPESANGYWYVTDGYSASHYKWYLREFTTGAGSNQSTLTINLDPNYSSDFIDLNTTTNNKIAFGVIFESQLPANSGNARTIIFDPVKGNSSYGGALDNQGASNQLNPFNANVDVQADFSSLSNSGGTLTLGLNNAVGQTINGTHDKIWLLVRYIGTPSNTLESITVSVS